MPPTALVTGATGCVGANVVAALLARGYDVRAMRRATSSLEALDGISLTVSVYPFPVELRLSPCVI